jgi:hypothetical protein
MSHGFTTKSPGEIRPGETDVLTAGRRCLADMVCQNRGCADMELCCRLRERAPRRERTLALYYEDEELDFSASQQRTARTVVMPADSSNGGKKSDLPLPF